jgi:hypothetical protein
MWCPEVGHRHVGFRCVSMSSQLCRPPLRMKVMSSKVCTSRCTALCVCVCVYVCMCVCIYAYRTQVGLVYWYRGGLI